MKVDGGENRSQLMEAKMHELERQIMTFIDKIVT